MMNTSTANIQRRSACGPATARVSPLCENTLREENRHFHGTGGVSQNNRAWGFKPAFIDLETNTVYLSRFEDGRCAPMHLVDGLPAELVLSRNSDGRVTALKKTVIAGFVRRDRFYTRDQAAAALAS